MRKFGVSLALAPAMVFMFANPGVASSSQLYTQSHWRFAGYATGYYQPSVDGVTTHFTVPTIRSAQSAGRALSVWVGLGGNFTGGQSITNGPSKFVQIGVSLNPAGMRPITSAWYELFRDSTQHADTYHKWGIPFVADPGDTVWLRLQWNHSHTALYMQWTNLATGQNVVNIVSDASLYDGLHGSHDPGAEVILEGQPDLPVMTFDGNLLVSYARELASNGRGLDSYGMPTSDVVGGLAPSSAPTTSTASPYWKSIRYVLYRNSNAVVVAGPRSGNASQFSASCPL